MEGLEKSYNVAQLAIRTSSKKLGLSTRIYHDTSLRETYLFEPTYPSWGVHLVPISSYKYQWHLGYLGCWSFSFRAINASSDSKARPQSAFDFDMSAISIHEWIEIGADGGGVAGDLHWLRTG